MSNVIKIKMYSTIEDTVICYDWYIEDDTICYVWYNGRWVPGYFNSPTIFEPMFNFLDENAYVYTFSAVKGVENKCEVIYKAHGEILVPYVQLNDLKYTLKTDLPLEN